MKCITKQRYTAHQLEPNVGSEDRWVLQVVAKIHKKKSTGHAGIRKSAGVKEFCWEQGARPVG